MLNPLANGKNQGLFNAFECFSSTSQGKFYFQGLFQTVLYFQVLFKPVPTLPSEVSEKYSGQNLGCFGHACGPGVNNTLIYSVFQILYDAKHMFRICL